MNCERMRELLSASLDGEATAEEREAAEQHADGCAACRLFLAQIREDQRALVAWPDEIPGEAADWRRLARGSRPGGFQRLAAAAAVIAALGIGFALGRAGDAGEGPEAEPRRPTLIEDRRVYPDTNETHALTLLAAASQPRGERP